MKALIRFFKIKIEARIKSALPEERFYFELKRLIAPENKSFFMQWRGYDREFIGSLTEAGFEVVNKPTFINVPTVKITGTCHWDNGRPTLLLNFRPTGMLHHLVITYLLGLVSFFLFAFGYLKTGFLFLSSLILITAVHFIVYKINCLDSLYIFRKSLKGSLLTKEQTISST